MGRYLVRRVLFMILVLFVVSLVTFTIFLKLPGGDPVRQMAGPNVRPEQLESIRHNLGLDRPFFVQYAKFAQGLIPYPGLFLNEDVYYSYRNRIPVKEEIFRRLPVTVALGLGAAVFWLLLGIPIGIVSAIKRRTAVDRAGMLFALFGVSAPVFWLGYIMLFIFWFKLGWAPPPGLDIGETVPQALFAGKFLLPWITLSLLYAAFYARMVRGNLIETMGEDYIRTARAKGLSERRVIFKHGLRAGLTPVVTMLGVDIGYLMGGLLITETVFDLDGIGKYAIQSIQDGDFPGVMGVTIFASFFVVLANLIVDVVYAALDPRGQVHVVAEPLLEVRNLKVHFPTDDGVVKAVDGVSYTVGRGETLGIVGESGSGKSVSMLTVMGLINKKQAKIEGEIIFQGRNLLEATPEEMREIRGAKISMIFQDPLTSLHPYYKVGDQIVEGLRAHQDISKGDAMTQAVEMLRKVGIPKPEDRAKQYPHEFSGGMRQRAMIAMALSLNPDLLIADEPTTALDVTVQAQILDLIGRLKDEFDASVAIITHDLGVVAEHADDVMVMYAGRIAEYGTRDDVYYRSHHPYTWGLLESIARIDQPKDERLRPIPGLPPSLINVPPGCPFHPRCRYVMDICKTDVPPLLSEDGRHSSACHLTLAEKERIFQEEVAANA